MRIGVVTVSRGSHVRTYVEHLVASGHQVTVMTNGRSYFGLDVEVVDLRPLGGRRLGLSSGTLARWRRGRLCSALSRGRFDVVNAQMVMFDALDALECSPSPVVLSFHGSDVLRRHEMPHRFAGRLADALPHAAAVHAVSRHMADELVSLGADPDRLSVFQYGIDTAMFSPGIDHRRAARIVSNRALKPLYRVSLLVEAMPAVLAEEPDAELVIYGDGPEESALREAVDRLGIGEAVAFEGVRPPQAIAADLARSGVWASMASSDGTPLSLLEAMASGAVPVAADLPTIHEWVEAPRGVLVDPSPAAVARGLLAGIALAREGSHEAENRRIVCERGERAVNLARFERLLADVAAGRPIRDVTAP